MILTLRFDGNNCTILDIYKKDTLTYGDTIFDLRWKCKGWKLLNKSCIWCECTAVIYQENAVTKRHKRTT